MASRSDICGILQNLLRDFPHVKSLRREQEECLENLASGKDVFASLPTGFGKSLIFQLFPRLMKALNGKNAATIVVVSPLVAIMTDQVKDRKAIGVSAAAIGIDDTSDQDEMCVTNGECEIVYGSPESWLSKRWRTELKEGKLGRQTVAIAIDEVHSITGWGLPQGKKGKKKAKDPFREAFGRVKDLRSFLPGVPMLALTATVQLNERAKLIKASGMIKPFTIDVCPNKENIVLDFMPIPNEKDAVTHLKWIADMVAEKGKETPQTIIFCNTFNDISNVLSYLLLILKEKAFIVSDDRKKDCLLGVYHARTWEFRKAEIEEDFRRNGMRRVVIATCALGMGINFPNVKYVVQFGPPTSVVDLMQQAGRGGRNGSQAHSVTYFTRRQLSRCGKDVKVVANTEGCQRKALYDHFSDSVSSLVPGHLCCSHCRSHCKCSADSCASIEPPYLKVTKQDEPEEVPSSITRCMTLTDENDLKMSLFELKQNYSMGGLSFFHDTISQSFTDELIDDIVKNAGRVCSSEYLYQNFSIYCTQHAMDILEVFQELFGDIANYEQDMERLCLINSEVLQSKSFTNNTNSVCAVLTPEDNEDTDFLHLDLPEYDVNF